MRSGKSRFFWGRPVPSRQRPAFIRLRFPSDKILCPTMALTIVTLTVVHAVGQESVTERGATVLINCPDQVDLQVMVDYVGKALDVRFLYGEELKNQRVDLRPSPVEIPKTQLLNLLASLLRVRDLAMVQESPNFYRIVRSDQTTRSVPVILDQQASLDPRALRIVTHVLAVPSGKVGDLVEKLRPFLSSPKSGLIPVPETGLIIVTDYESRIALLKELIGILDIGRAKVEARTLAVGGADPAVVAGQLSTLLTQMHRLRQASGPPPSVRGEIVPGAVIVIGRPDQITEAEEIISRLVPTRAALITHTYSPRYLSIDRARKLIENVVLAPGKTIVPPAAIYEDAQGGRLFITAEAATHAAIEALLQDEDRPLPAAERPLRIYRPKNRKAADLLTTLTQLLGESVLITTIEPAQAETRNRRPRRPPGPNRPPGTGHRRYCSGSAHATGSRTTPG